MYENETKKSAVWDQSFGDGPQTERNITRYAAAVQKNVLFDTSSPFVQCEPAHWQLTEKLLCSSVEKHWALKAVSDAQISIERESAVKNDAY